MDWYRRPMVQVKPIRTPAAAGASQVRRSAKRDKVLDVGGRLLNNQGAAGISLAEIAEQLGMSRNALYYYVKDRADLVRQCYDRASDTVEADLCTVSSSGRSAPDQIKELIRLSLSPDRAQLAVLADIDTLDEAGRIEILARHERQIDAFKKILISGQKEGVFRPLDPELASYALFGMMNWSRLWIGWLNEHESAANDRRLEAVRAIQDIFLDGLCSPPHPDFACHLDYAQLTHQHYNVFEKSDANRLRQQQLIEAASLLFNRRGLDGVSTDAIAEAVGASKGVVYHHFKDKAELIQQCHERAFQHYEMIIEVAKKRGGDPLQNMLIVFHLNCQAQASASPPLILQPGLMRLPTQYLDRARQISLKMTKSLVQAGNAGLVRTHALEIVNVSAGAFFWIQKWRGDRAGMSARSIADQMTQLMISGIRS